MKKFLFLAIISIGAISCQRILEQKIYNESRKNYTSPFQGNWVGNYSGHREGKLEIVVSKSGTMTIKRIFDNQSETFYGEVYENGSFLGGTSETGFTLRGNLLQNGGTWLQGNYSGTWTIAKQ